MKTILDLCSGTGAWSQPYADAGYDVVRVDLEPGSDARLWPSPATQWRTEVRLPGEFTDVRDLDIHGVLAAPVCTVFAGSGARWPRSDAEIREGLALVDACIRIVYAVRPKWWALENPVGKLAKWLGDPAMRFQPCDYGDPYTKRTLLWGDFTAPKTSPVEPTDGSKMWANYGGKNDRTKAARSATPPGFAKAFYVANP